MDRRSGGGGGGVTCVFGKKYRASSFKISSCHCKLKFNKKAGNQTARDLFCFYFSPGYFFNVASGGWGKGGGYLYSTM